jgi:hypothetical protein
MTGMQQCFVAFLDILGFRDLTLRCENDSSLRERLLIALLENHQVPRFSSHTISNTPGYSGTWTLQTQVVSDTVILFIPAMIDHAANLLSSVRVLHDRLFGNSVLLRGAITIGDMYWSDEWSTLSDLHRPPRPTIAFGQGLIDAYEMESKLAVYPRILVSDHFAEYVTKNSWNDESNRLCEGNLDTVFRCCENGLHHFDVLHPSIKRVPKLTVVAGTVQSEQAENDLAAMAHPEYISHYRSVLAELLNEKNPRARAKLLWLASYFNIAVKGLSYGEALNTDVQDSVSPSNAALMDRNVSL